jgi:hypothetical protein
MSSGHALKASDSFHCRTCSRRLPTSCAPITGAQLGDDRINLGLTLGFLALGHVRHAGCSTMRRDVPPDALPPFFSQIN